MSRFVVNLAKTTFVFTALFTLASSAYSSTISSFVISTTAGFQENPCSMSGSGPASESCSSIVHDQFGSSAEASITLTDNSLESSVGSFADSDGSAFASITHDDFYTVPVNGPVSAVLTLTCDNIPNSIGTTGHFSLGSTNVSPPVESIYTGASQGSGPCGAPNTKFGFGGTNTFIVSLDATNNLVHLHTYIDGSSQPPADSSSSIFVQLTVDGFQDANGNPITATLLPEPGTLGTFALALLVGE
jgi:hypothetical protein